MRAILMKTHQKAQYHTGYYHAHVPHMCVHGAPYLGNPPPCVNPSLTIQFIEFTYTNYRFYEDKVNVKIAKYQPLINDIKTLGWKVAPLIVIIAEVRGTTHIRSITQLHTTYK
jgi:hypothetical protein